MTDNHPALQFAQFKLREKSGIPVDIFNEIDAHLALANEPLPKPNLKNTLELVAQYSDLQRQKIEQEEKRRLAEEEKKAQSTLLADPAVAQALASGAAIASVDVSSGIPPPPTGGLQRSRTAEDQMTSQEFAVNEMMQETKESKDVCIFYLESTNWDLSAAVELLRSMQVR